MCVCVCVCVCVLKIYAILITSTDDQEIHKVECWVILFVFIFDNFVILVLRYCFVFKTISFAFVGIAVLVFK